MYRGKTIAVVCPAYNEEFLIADTINSIPDFVDKLYVVNDGSTDKTAEIIESLSNDRLCCINHGKNKGVGAAISSGYKQAIMDNLDIAVVMAGDHQMDPSYLPALLTPIIEGKADYVKGNRVIMRHYRQGMTKFRTLGNWLLKWLTKIASGNYEINDPQDGYTAISIDALKKMDVENIYPYYGYCNDIIIKLTALKCRIIEVPRPYTFTNDAISKIKYHRYIPKVSWLLLKAFLNRIKRNYFSKPGVKTLP